MVESAVANVASQAARWLTLTVLVALQLASLPARAESANPDAVAERRVKAAYLHRFAGYVEWPEGAFARADSPLLVGVWGNDDLAEDLARLVVGRTVDGRRIEVRRVKDTDPPSALHILFVGRDRMTRLAEATGGLQSRGTLVVTESPGALRQGSSINFVLSEGQIRFEVSLDAAEKHGLKLSSRLVAVAQNTPAKVPR
jgi:hypothetical protein